MEALEGRLSSPSAISQRGSVPSKHGTGRPRPGPRQPGRPRISKELQGLIARIATENPRWGAVRIQGELLALGYAVSTETVRCYRRRALRRPPSQSWRTFLANHRPQLWCAVSLMDPRSV